jgi:SAM-dependent methyltransferase
MSARSFRRAGALVPLCTSHWEMRGTSHWKMRAAGRTDPGQAGDIRYVAGDLLTSDIEPASFDLVCAVASLHHVDARSGLVRLQSLVAPGGVLVVIGLARPDLPKDLPVEIAAQVVGRIRRRRGRPDEVPQPPIVWPPPQRYSTMRSLATELLPGVRWRRHLLWRYSLVWTKTRG